MKDYLSVMVMVALAIVIPLVWSAVDAHRRLGLQQTAHVACLMHRKVEHCTHLMPEKLHPSTYQYCVMHNTHNECAEFNPNH